MDSEDSFFNRDSFKFVSSLNQNSSKHHKKLHRLFSKNLNQMEISLFENQVEDIGLLSGTVSLLINDTLPRGSIVMTLLSEEKVALKKNKKMETGVKDSQTVIDQNRKLIKLQDEILAKRMETEALQLEKNEEVGQVEEVSPNNMSRKPLKHLRNQKYINSKDVTISSKKLAPLGSSTLFNRESYRKK